MADISPIRDMRIRDITNDIPSMGYLSCCAINACALFMIIGFFAGSGLLHSSMEPCVDQAEIEMSRHWEASHHGVEMHALKEIYHCIVKTDAFVMNNAEGEYFKILLPVLVSTFVNILVFASLLYCRASRINRLSQHTDKGICKAVVEHERSRERNYKFLEPCREQKQAKSLPAQRHADKAIKSTHKRPSGHLAPGAKIVESDTLPTLPEVEAAAGLVPGPQGPGHGTQGPGPGVRGAGPTATGQKSRSEVTTQVDIVRSGKEKACQTSKSRADVLEVE